MYYAVTERIDFVENSIHNTFDIILDILDLIGMKVFLENDIDDINLSEIGFDSVTFISFVVEIEDRFQIEIPDEFLILDNVVSLRGFSNLIDSLVEETIDNCITV